jgi:glycerol kinase
MSSCLLAIDQGTTSSRAIGFDTDGRVLAVAQQEFPQIYPNDGWVEHAPNAIWETTVAVCGQVLEQITAAGHEPAGIGITNQRETTVVWERDSGEPVYNAIVWQDRRTAPRCAQLRADGTEATVTAKTGLLLDPYFSATKLEWILTQTPRGIERARSGELLFGTIDTFLIWRLTQGAVHATDATNASRTMLFNIHTQQWDDELLALFDVPVAMLPVVHDCAADYGVATLQTRRIPICGVAGDQQAASIGQACFEPGMIKSTYGTGCFMMMNTGRTPVESQHRLLTTVAYRFDGTAHYALEGSIFNAGTAVQWLRDQLRVINDASETAALAASVESSGGVYLVPAFTGLGAPHWDADARGAILGITRDTGIAELARAALEAVCYQTQDLITAMRSDGADKPTALRVDGGMTHNDWLLQFLADMIDCKVQRPEVVETTALGAAYLAALQSGLIESTDDIAARWRCGIEFEPDIAPTRREALLRGWVQSVSRTRTT